MVMAAPLSWRRASYRQHNGQSQKPSSAPGLDDGERAPKSADPVSAKRASRSGEGGKAIATTELSLVGPERARGAHRWSQPAWATEVKARRPTAPVPAGWADSPAHNS